MTILAEKSFQSIALYGNTVMLPHTQQASQVYAVENETGCGEITRYQIAEGIELYDNDLHVAYCQRAPLTAKNIIEINHCQRGRYECCFGENSCCYIAEGDLSIGALNRAKSAASFPLNDYRGMTIFIDLDRLPPTTYNEMAALGIELTKIQQAICEESRLYLLRDDPAISQILATLYHAPKQRKVGYAKLKTFELLLFLSDLDECSERLSVDYYDQRQIQRVKSVAQFITADPSKHYTIEQLAQRFDISATSLKKCFKGVYGSSIYAYLKTYRLQTAEKMLRQTNLPITEISAQIGYDNPAKFTAAFKQYKGITPSAWRKRCLNG